MKKLDRYSAMICSKFLQNENDFINLVSVCKKFQEIPSMFHYNPIPLTTISKKLFSKMESEYIYTPRPNTIIQPSPHETVIWYPVEYDECNPKMDAKHYKRVVFTLSLHKTLEQIPNFVFKVKRGGVSLNREILHKLPSSVRVIGQKWYTFNTLSDVTIPTHITQLDKNAFLLCREVQSVMIPDSVNSIGVSCFQSCDLLKSVVLSSELKSIPSSCFNSCSQLSSVTIPIHVTSFGKQAFDNCRSLERIQIPEGVCEIGDDCFAHCARLREINIPSKIQRIFRDLELTADDSSYFNVEDDIPSNVKRIEVFGLSKASWQNPYKLTTLVIPSTVQIIDSFNFHECSDLKEVVFEMDIIHFEIGALKNLRLLTKVKLPNKLKEVSDEMFSCCQELEEIEIPEQVTSIGVNAFWGCVKLESVKLPKQLEVIHKCAFKLCEELKSIKIPDGVKQVEDSAFERCDALETVYMLNTKPLSEIVIFPIAKVVVKNKENIRSDVNGLLKKEDSCIVV
ncbi:hypothetical protein EIN_171810 [Entamoeba invadens IP1]|uniref:Leucine rich repeat containing protein BspA family protein n=1 Tax=Entamoeba invadens IP1 TaxID=370355 RepID=A0A0A1TVW7_ENTIV|nr:hypothetical protein EIN_171810 [Entamoeba invadens IP1]ELP84586.1 hypothetical protein EIN_171810 [Entamoeba invadens IP1]|eukprot:XP_004183932.1 hypothetical protein EIN_171810 [Entamoeba invadens IP1]